MDILVDILRAMLFGGVAYAVVFVAALVNILYERRFMAFIGDRLGPNRTGPQGALQSIADAFKMMGKEDFRPLLADPVLFTLAPVTVMIGAVAIQLVLPYTGGFLATDLDIGIIFLVAITSFTTLSILMGGWASRNKYSLVGALRAAAQMISYEICLGLSVVGIFMAAGTLRLLDVVAVQADGAWNVFTQPLGFLVFVVAAFAETNRLPFDLPEAETELVAGYHTEYSSMKFAMFFLGEYTAMFVFSALVAVLFLGGWDVPLVSEATLRMLGNWGALLGFLSFMAKTLAFLFFYVWVRWTIPRFRFDQLMALGWKVLIPVALVNIALTGLFHLGGR